MKQTGLGHVGPPLPVPTGERRARAGATPFLCPGKALEEESE